ncbi:MAG: peptidase domain-containing ABC transporter [Candidatus Lokiarchaeia archaeon]
MKEFPNYTQLYSKDCGPTCLQIISKFYGKYFDLDYLLKLSNTSRLGTSLSNLSNAAEKLGFKTIAAQIEYQDIFKAPLPCILFWENNHYSVLYKADKYFHISDPLSGYLKLTEAEFKKGWEKETTKNKFEGVCLILEPTNDFYNQTESKKRKTLNFTFLKSFFKPQKKIIYQLFIGLFIGVLIQLIFPFITQSLVDKGIVNKDIPFIYLLLFAQVVLYISYVIVEWFRSKILLFLGTKIRIYLMSDFVSRLLKLPLAFFDIKQTGDILTRIKDHHRIKKLITTSSLSFLFSFFTIIVFSIVLGIYNYKLFLLFLIGTFVYFLWFSSFLKKRAFLDNQEFKIEGQDSGIIVEIVDAMHDIKLNNAELRQRWKWENIQKNMFDVENNQLTITNRQVFGSMIINEFKNILLTFYAAFLTLNGELTLGMLLAVMYIIAQLNNPLNNILVFIQEFQDAYLSLLRLNEFNSENNIDYDSEKLVNLPKSGNIQIKDLSFKYPGTDNYILSNIDLTITKGSKVAIVGKSGSGKTTLLKLLLKFYEPSKGHILFNSIDSTKINEKQLWENSGIVLQEGKILNDTLKNNISLSSDTFEVENYERAITIANLKDFISSLPLDSSTLIGSQGLGISGGEKQRILLARALYKNPEYIFLDEATSSLDTENEKIIINNLEAYFTNKTSFTIAHRLSTVKNADIILVLANGSIIEQGTHKELIALKKHYFTLIKNQLELGV